MPSPRKQAHRLADWLTRDQPSLRAVVLGARREGKSDLLAQIHQQLFAGADGPLPFWFRFEPVPEPDAARQALRLAAHFCHQMRAFLLRQDELLAETPGELAAEIGRPGLPLALHELASEILAAAQENRPPADLLRLAALLPARFAQREGRPVCLLWDDCHVLPGHSPFLSALDATGGAAARPSPLCAVLTGLAPWMRELAGARNLTTIQLEPFALSEALLMAEAGCKASGVRFHREAWESWFALCGTSPGWAVPLIEAAGLRGEPLESIEQIGRLYASELESGSLNCWLSARWPLAPEVRPAPEMTPQAIARLLSGGEAGALARGGVQPPEQAGQNVLSLHRQELLRLRPFGAENSLSPVEADWLRLETDRAAMGSARARARLLQEFLLRAHGLRALAERSAASGELGLDAIEEHLLYPPSPGAAIRTASGDLIRLPEFSSVVREATPEAELFWCFGAGSTAKPSRKPSSTPAAAQQEVPCLILLAHTSTAPAKSLVAEWSRRLQQEVVRPNEASGALGTDLWVVVPAGAPLAPTGGEKRFSRETLGRLLTSVPAESAEPAASRPGAGEELAVDEIGRKLAELQARAKSLQQDFRSSRSTSATAEVSTPASGQTSDASAPISQRDEYLRQALSLSLMLASADLVATGSGAADSGARTQSSLADLQFQCQQLLEQLHKQAGRGEGPSAAATRRPLPPARS